MIEISKAKKNYIMNIRPRRNRKSPVIRAMVEETTLRPSQLVLPLFLVDGKGIQDPVRSLPVANRYSVDKALTEIASCIDLGIQSFILFPSVVEAKKDQMATYALDPDNFYLRAAQEMKSKFGDRICLISDVALDPYNSDGHDGLVQDGKILNDATIPILAQMAVLQADAGFDIIGPSDMMDGRILGIREALEYHGHHETSIMSYTAKYASAFYGPFRDALDSAPKAGDKKTYQMNPANRIEAYREIQLDEEEGADFLMVKPALHYLDVINEMKAASTLPVVAYHVSGECAMLIAAAQNGWLAFDIAMPETLLSIRRAGADIIITYFAKEYAKQYQ